MGISKNFNHVKLFSGFIYKERADFINALKILTEKFHDTDLISDEIVFDKTDYYYEEMGTPLFRTFVSFKDHINPEKLPDIKLLTDSIETDFSVNSKRKINIDPGYISEANVIIATTKNHYHRVPLNKGIYAHIEYVIKGKNFGFLEWTYPDFKTEEYLEFFRNLKIMYKADRKLRRKNEKSSS